MDLAAGYIRMLRTSNCCIKPLLISWVLIVTMAMASVSRQYAAPTVQVKNCVCGRSCINVELQFADIRSDIKPLSTSRVAILSPLNDVPFPSTGNGSLVTAVHLFRVRPFSDFFPPSGDDDESIIYLTRQRLRMGGSLVIRHA